MPIDWTNFSPSEIPKNPANIENTDISVPADTDGSGDPTEITMGPKKVFKTGYPTSRSVSPGGGILARKSKEPGDTMRIRPLVASRDVQLLNIHGVADADQVQEILHPREQSALDSLMRQEAFIVTKELKVIDVASSDWPINLEAMPDVRATLMTPVRHGEEIGVVAGIQQDEHVIFKGRQASVVALQDLEPLMLNRSTTRGN